MQDLGQNEVLLLMMIINLVSTMSSHYTSPHGLTSLPQLVHTTAWPSTYSFCAQAENGHLSVSFQGLGIASCDRDARRDKPKINAWAAYAL